MKILLPEITEINQQALELLRKNGHQLFSSTKQIPAAEIEVLFIRTYTRADKKYLDLFPKLKYLLRAGVGLDNIDLEECKKRNIIVFNAPGSNANAVAEFVIGIILVLLRNIINQAEKIKKNSWRSKIWQGNEIVGKTLGLVGCGAIGKLLAQKLGNFGLKSILGYDPYLDEKTLAKNGITKTDLKTLISSSDIISLHLPLTEQTRNLIGLKEIRTMKKTTLLINTSRGGIINETELIKALKNNLIRGAALDVFETEPNVRKSLLVLKNLVATPHIAGYTREADFQMAILPVNRFLTCLSRSSI